MLKGHFVVLDIQTQNFNIYNINEVIKQTQSTYFFYQRMQTMFSEENKVPDHRLKLERNKGIKE